MHAKQQRQQQLQISNKRKLNETMTTKNNLTRKIFFRVGMNFQINIKENENLLFIIIP